MLTKWLFFKPISAALAFISSTNSSTLPDRCSAKATAPSLALAMITPFNSSSTVCCSPGSRYIWLPPMEAAFSEMVTLSFVAIFPLSQASSNKSSVITLVTDAGGRCFFAFCAKSTRPLFPSMSTAAFASIFMPPSVDAFCDPSAPAFAEVCCASPPMICKDRFCG